MDCATATGYATGPNHLAGLQAALMDGQTFAGMQTVSSTGTVPTMGIPAARLQWGLPFTARMDFWPIELVESSRLGLLRARVIRVSASVQNTTSFQFICNRHTKTVAEYPTGADYIGQTDLKTAVFRCPILGRRDHPSLSLVKHEPGPFRVLTFTQEVQG